MLDFRTTYPPLTLAVVGPRLCGPHVFANLVHSNLRRAPMEATVDTLVKNMEPHSEQVRPPHLDNSIVEVSLSICGTLELLLGCISLLLIVQFSLSFSSLQIHIYYKYKLQMNMAHITYAAKILLLHNNDKNYISCKRYFTPE